MSARRRRPLTPLHSGRGVGGRGGTRGARLPGPGTYVSGPRPLMTRRRGAGRDARRGSQRAGPSRRPGPGPRPRPRPSPRAVGAPGSGRTRGAGADRAGRGAPRPSEAQPRPRPPASRARRAPRGCRRAGPRRCPGSLPQPPGPAATRPGCRVVGTRAPPARLPGPSLPAGATGPLPRHEAPPSKPSRSRFPSWVTQPRPETPRPVVAGVGHLGPSRDESRKPPLSPGNLPRDRPSKETRNGG